MKYISYQRDGLQSIGIWQNERICDIPGMARSFGEKGMPNTMLAFLEDFERFHQMVSDMFSGVNSSARPELFFPAGQAQILSPVPSPRSLRIFFGSREYLDFLHKKYTPGAHEPPSLEPPIGYFGNHQSILRPGINVVVPVSTSQLDYELHLAAIIGRKGTNIPVEDAARHIAGLTILNNWVARDREKEAFRYSLFPMKTYDFATTLGPYLVSSDELRPALQGNRYHLRMTATVNSELYGEGNTSEYSFSFAELVAHASLNSMLSPGDIISAGCLKNGCILGSEHDTWLQPGDEIVLEVEKLGMLRNGVTSQS